MPFSLKAKLDQRRHVEEDVRGVPVWHRPAAPRLDHDLIVR